MCDLHDPDAPDTPSGINEFIDELVVSLTNSRIYWKEHPRVASSVQSLSRILESYLARTGAAHLELGASDGYLFHQQRPLLGASLSAPRIILPLASLDSGGLVFARGATADEMLALVEILGGRSDACGNFQEANQALESLGCTTIRLLPKYGVVEGGASLHQGGTGTGGGSSDGDGTGGSGEGSGPRNLPFQLYQGMVSSLQEVMIRATRGEPFAVDQTRGHVEAVLQQLTHDPKSMMNICRYEQYDAFTFGHSIRVCSLALYFAKTLTKDQELLHRLGTSALLHDVGKAWVPFDILYAKGRLTPEERREMDKHTLYGGDILLGMDDSDPMAVATAFGHHKRAAAARGPSASFATPLSMVTRVIKICDVYEALTAVRPYKDRMSSVRAYRIMMSMEQHFDLALLRRFIAVNGIFPVGSQVLLNNGEIARVHEQTGAIDRPIVDIEVSREGGALAQEDWRRVDLSQPTGKEDLSIERAILDSGMESTQAA